MDQDELAQVIYDWKIRDREQYEWEPTIVSDVVQAQSLAQWLLARGALGRASELH